MYELCNPALLTTCNYFISNKTYVSVQPCYISINEKCNTNICLSRNFNNSIDLETKYLMVMLISKLSASLYIAQNNRNDNYYASDIGNECVHLPLLCQSYNFNYEE